MMTKKELMEGIFDINEWIAEVSNVYQETETDESNKHIKHYYKVLDELEKIVMGLLIK